MPVTRICGFRRLLDECRRELVDGAALVGAHRAGFVDRLADDVDDASERLVADRNSDRLAGVDDVLSANQTLGGVHRDGAHGVFTEVLRHFQDETLAIVDGLERVQDLRQLAGELHVDDGADDLRDLAGGGLRQHRLHRRRGGRLLRSGLDGRGLHSRRGGFGLHGHRLGRSLTATGLAAAFATGFAAAGLAAFSTGFAAFAAGLAAFAAAAGVFVVGALAIV